VKHHNHHRFFNQQELIFTPPRKQLLLTLQLITTTDSRHAIQLISSPRWQQLGATSSSRSPCSSSHRRISDVRRPLFLQPNFSFFLLKKKIFISLLLRKQGNYIILQGYQLHHTDHNTTQGAQPKRKNRQTRLQETVCTAKEQKN
jgi:hypothetical protein